MKSKKMKETKKNKKRETNKTKETIALTLALMAIAFLLINAFYLLISRDKVVVAILESGSLKDTDANILNMLPSLVTSLAIVWLVLAVIMSFIVYFLEKQKCKWYWLLVISIITLFSGRVETLVLGIIASFLYKR